jgi:tryptophan synthase beta chain
VAPLISQTILEGLLEPRSYDQLESYESALTWARTEGFIAAPETSQALACVIDEAKKAREEGKEKVILFCYSGHGLMDLMGYQKYLAGELQDYPLPDEALATSLEALKEYPKPQVKTSGRW